eukprot:150351_1
MAYRKTRRTRNPKIRALSIISQTNEETIFESFSRNKLLSFEDDSLKINNVYGYPTRIKKFVTMDKEAGIVSTIYTKKGETLTECTLHESAYIKEMYLSQLATVNKLDLFKRKWITKSQYNKILLPLTYTTQFSIGKKTIYCTLLFEQLVVKGKIRGVNPHTFAGQISAEFLFKADDPSLTTIANGWKYAAQLSYKNEEWKQIDISDIQIQTIRHLISIKYFKYLDSPLITKINPRDIIKESAFFGKPDLYMQRIAHLKDCLSSIDLMKSLSIHIIVNLVESTYFLCGKAASILTFSLKRRITTNIALKHGSYITESLFDVGIGRLVHDLDVELNYKKNIKFEFTPSQYEQIGISKILKKYSNGKQTEIIGNIQFIYHRKTSHLIIPKFGFSTKSKRKLQRERRSRRR